VSAKQVEEEEEEEEEPPAPRGLFSFGSKKASTIPGTVIMRGGIITSSNNGSQQE
jgi:hypothetical protein